jgi:hypothetical protein
MSSRPNIKTLVAVVTLGAFLAGCSEFYWDRRETIALGANDAVEADKVVHMVDPWPRHSANNNIAFNGERQQAAYQRYRQNHVTTPVNVTTTSVAYQKAQQDAAAAAAQQAATPAAPVKGP